MSTITVLPDDPQATPARFRAVSGDRQSVGATVGEALDALTADLNGPPETTLVVVQPMTPDALFTAAQQQRLGELMTRWRTGRDAGSPLPPAEQAELDDLIRAEVEAAGKRAAASVRQTHFTA